MGLEVYYPADIRNALLAAEQSSNAALLAAAGDGDLVQGFQMGYRAALTTIALAFGLIRAGEKRGRKEPPDTLTFLFLGWGNEQATD